MDSLDWPALCGSQQVYVWRDGDFSPCFRDGVVSSVPVLSLLLYMLYLCLFVPLVSRFGAASVRGAFRLNERLTQLIFLTRVQQAIITFLMLVVAVSLVYVELVQTAPSSPAHVFLLLLEFFTWTSNLTLFSLCIHVVLRRNRLFWFGLLWLLSTAAEVLRFRTEVLLSRYDVLFVLSCLSLVAKSLVSILFVFCMYPLLRPRVRPRTLSTFMSNLTPATAIVTARSASVTSSSSSAVVASTVPRRHSSPRTSSPRPARHSDSNLQQALLSSGYQFASSSSSSHDDTGQHHHHHLDEEEEDDAENEWYTLQEEEEGWDVEYSKDGERERRRRIGCCSFLTFWWVNRLIGLGQSGTIDPEALDPLTGVDSTTNVASNFADIWSKQLQSGSPSLVRAFWSAWGMRYVWLGVLKLLSDSCMFTGPILLEQLVTFIENGDQPAHNGFLYAVGLILGSFVGAVLSSHYGYGVNRMSLWVRTSLVTRVYAKALSIDGSAKRQFSSGEIANLMSVDTQRVMDVCGSFHQFWSLPVQIAIALYLLYGQVGNSVFAGLGVVLVLIPLNMVLTKQIATVSAVMMTCRDRRMELTNEMLHHIRIIKYFAWENRFARKISAAREDELVNLRKFKYLDAFCVYFWVTTPILVSLVTFVSYSATGQTLSASRVFTSLALFQILILPLNAFPWVINGLVEAAVSALRLFVFLGAKDSTGRNTLLPQTTGTTSSSLRNSHPIQPKQEEKNDGVTAVNPVVILVRNATFVHSDIDRRKEQQQVKEKQEQQSQKNKKPTVPAPTANSDSTASVLIPVKAYSSEPHRTPTLINLNVQVTKGQFIGITGRVGSGKSSLLCALLGELSQLSGDMWIQGSCGYVAQEAWIQNASVRANILFGLPYSERRYNEVVFACALAPDFNQLISGDATEIGERGINLSGGQKIRVTLARAVYADADIYLLDDVLSAVDVHVGAHLMQHCVLGLLNKKTILFVTHHLQALTHADWTVVLDHGRISRVVSSSELPSLQDQLQQELQLELDAQPTPSSATTSTAVGTMSKPVTAASPTTVPSSPVSIPVVAPRSQLPSSSISARSPLLGSLKAAIVPTAPILTGLSRDNSLSKPLHSVDHKRKIEPLGKGDDWEADTDTDAEVDGPASGDTDDEKEDDVAADHGKLIQNEGREVGRIRFHVLRSYVSAVGYGLTSFILISLTLMRASGNANDLWLSYWVSNVDAHSTMFYLEGLGIIAAANSVFTLLRAFSFAFGGLQAARDLFAALLTAMLHAPLLFYDRTPVGRILNRFSRDMYAIDEQIPFVSNILLAQLFNLLGSLAVICISTLYFLFMLPPLGFMYYRVQHRYRAASRELKRLDSVTRSPIFSKFSETLSGVHTIRAFDAQARFRAENVLLLDQNQRIYMAGIEAGQWLGFRLQIIGVVVVAAVSLFAVVEYQYGGGTISPALVGLALSYALNITGTLNALIGSFTETEKEIVSVERAMEYMNVAPEQAPDKQLLPVPSAAWPERGEIIASNIVFVYRPHLPPALNGINFHIAPGQSVGIVGRTGSGKTSCFEALFRTRELSHGCLVVDGMDVSRVSVYELRARLGIIPQAPMLFSGTIRDNLLPADAQDITDKQLLSDGYLWDVLSKCYMAGKVRSLDGGLDAVVNENADNFSVGERQLLSLGRALIKRARILCLDEASSSVDATTDALIQRTIRESFRGCTLLVIAHRLATVMDLDRVMVLDSGRVIEFGAPQALMNKPTSAFGLLVRSSGGAGAPAMNGGATSAGLIASSPASSPPALRRNLTDIGP